MDVDREWYDRQKLGRCFNTSAIEIHSNLEGEDVHSCEKARIKSATLGGVIIQIMLLDIVFSIDSVITAIGLVEQVAIMVAAIVIAIIFMMVLAGKISAFVEGHPMVKILALSFLLLIGVSLVGEGLDLHIPKGFIYFAMAFSTFVEILNLRVRRGKRMPIKLRHPRAGEIGHNA